MDTHLSNKEAHPRVVVPVLGCPIQDYQGPPPKRGPLARLSIIFNKKIVCY